MSELLSLVCRYSLRTRNDLSDIERRQFVCSEPNYNNVRAVVALTRHIDGAEDAWPVKMTKPLQSLVCVRFVRNGEFGNRAQASRAHQPVDSLLECSGIRLRTRHDERLSRSIAQIPMTSL